MWIVTFVQSKFFVEVMGLAKLIDDLGSRAKATSNRGLPPPLHPHLHP